MTPFEQFTTRMAPFQSQKTLGLAVSGGADSMAMLHMTNKWAHQHTVTLKVFTFNHNLRAAATQEADMVAQWCAQNNIHHTTETWHEKPAGNLMENARTARYTAIGNWRSDINVVLVGHTKTDRAETVLMRLFRGSGVDGFAGLQPMHTYRAPNGAYTVLRPMIDLTRETIRHYCVAHNVPFKDDPSNDDMTSLRVQARSFMYTMGMDEDALIKTARRMQRAQSALNHCVTQFWATHVTKTSAPGLAIDHKAFLKEPEDIKMRIVRKAIMDLRTPTHPPREKAIETVVAALIEKRNTTLGGCFFKHKKNTILIILEP